MPPKKKAAVKGPFFFFMLEFRARQQAKGQQFPGGMEQVMREAGPHWDKLDDEMREVYKDKAKAYKKLPKQNYGEKYTAQGIPYSVVEKEQRERAAKVELIRNSIAERIQTACVRNELEAMKVYFIAFNHFCKTTSNVYVPAEMALAKYSLENGVMAKMHEYINPQKIPLGLALDAITWSEETHRLPVPPDSKGETDFSVLLEKLLNFIDFEEEKKCKNFLLFTDAKDVGETENILSQFTEDSKILFPFLVCPLGEFFYQLKVATERYGLGLDKPNFPGRTIADVLLKKDPYEYTGGISCDFHEDLGNPRYCALSRVIRWAYMISDNCCLDLNIEVISGQHLPANADTTLCTDMTQSDSKSFVSSSDLTHVSLPKILKQGRSKSPFRNMDDINGSVIYSSRGGTVKDCDQKSVASDKLNETNPFYAALKARPGPSSSALDTKSFNPFSRQAQLDETRQPRDVGVVGHGRGALLSGLRGKSALAGGCGGFASQSEVCSSVGGGCDSSVKFSDCDDD
ncbi:hypothetical protein pipiens_003983 [Culex pipiens pipiens]|uniref:HMG box domain-containing protein n=1 Tax=Culex pipiens pipiens TaxID=38569 RepID=A0ABD1CPT7_CULPP